MRLTTSSGSDFEDSAKRIHKTLARLRSRQELLIALLLDQTPRAEVKFKSSEGDTDLQKFWDTKQENILMRTEVSHNQVLVAHKKAEAARLKQQVDEARKRQDVWLEQTMIRDMVELDTPTPTLAALRARERLADLSRCIREKESQVISLQQQLQQDSRKDNLRSSQSFDAIVRCEELSRKRREIEEHTTMCVNEVADCRSRIDATVAERTELEHRLDFLRASQEQIQKASVEHAAEAIRLRECLERTRAECQRHEQQAQLDAEELLRLRRQASSASRPASRSPPEVVRRPTPTRRDVLEQSGAHPDLADDLQRANAHNEWLREQLQQLSGGRIPAASPRSTAALPRDVSPVKPPEATPEKAPEKAGGELDSTIMALEAQMRALAAHNETLVLNSPALPQKSPALGPQ